MPSASETISISIHAPREGSDRGNAYNADNVTLFLSTLPARGATGRWPRWPAAGGDFYPRSPRGERLDVQQVADDRFLISIHAPREGSDATAHLYYTGGKTISIHAPREGSDKFLPRLR